MTQVARYGHMLEVKIDSVRMRVLAHYRVDGSVQDDSVQAQMIGAETTLELTSSAPPELVARLVKNSERGCYVMQALQKPVPITSRTLLNDRPLSLP